MPIKVKGMSYRPVQLPELRDAVFFGQTKTYTDAQRQICDSMEAAFRNGSLALLEEAPALKTESKPVFTPLTDTIQNLTAVSQDPAPKQEQVSASSMNEIAERVVAAVVAKMSEVAPTPTPPAEPAKPAVPDATVEAIASLSRKLDGMMISGPGVTSQKVLSAEDHATAVADTYIPDIRVDDMSNNIKLESRSLGQGGQVNSALAALRKLQKDKT